MSYKVPLDFTEFFQTTAPGNPNRGAPLPLKFSETERMRESIDDFVEMLISTHRGECRFLYDFGFTFWGYQFDNISIDHFNNSEYPKKEFERQLQLSISKYETRLENVGVEIILTYPALTHTVKQNVYSVIIKISGKTKTYPAESYQRTLVFSSDTMMKFK